MISIGFFGCMCFKVLRKYFKGEHNRKNGKIQSWKMEKAIVRGRDISESYLHGGKAIDKILNQKRKYRIYNMVNTYTF